MPWLSLSPTMFCKLSSLSLLLALLCVSASTAAMETVHDAGRSWVTSRTRECTKTARSARLARALVDSDDAAATLATVFPADHPTMAGKYVFLS